MRVTPTTMRRKGEGAEEEEGKEDDEVEEAEEGDTEKADQPLTVCG